MTYRKAGAVAIGLVVAAGLCAFGTLVWCGRVLWNLVFPPLLGTPDMSLLQSVALWVFLLSVFGTGRIVMGALKQ